MCVIARHYNPPPKAIEPVPIALGLYAVFTGFRLWLALRRCLAAPLLVASVVIDMTALMITVWSFHLQYMAPSAISLKAATLMYVFMLIALRALRFDAFYALLAGACAILGWASLVGYALLVDPMPGVITADLEAAIHAYIAETNADPKPFVWTKTADLGPLRGPSRASVARFCLQTSNSDHSAQPAPRVHAERGQDVLSRSLVGAPGPAEYARPSSLGLPRPHRLRPSR